MNPNLTKFPFLKYIIILIIIFSSIGFYQCEDPHKRFETPEWLKGDNINTLKERGDCNHFLELMEKSGYTTSLENQLFTLFVPNDSAFELYMKDVGIDSIGELTEREAEELFGLHILINPRSRDQLLYEYSFGQLETDEGEYGSLFYRKRTYSKPRDYSEVVLYSPNYKGDTLKITSENTFIPFFTTEFFEDYYGDPEGSDYLFMYPGSKWSGTQWGDAMVTEAEVRTTSGFIYFLDRVVVTRPTIDRYMRDNEDKFGLFYDIAQRFATYSIAGFDENRNRVYNKIYNQITNIASETGPESDVTWAMFNIFSSFIPNNETLQEYLDNTVFKYYDAIDSVPELFWVNLLNSHLYNKLSIKTRIAKAYKNIYGDEFDIDVDNDIVSAYMCTNGPVYEMNRVLEPNIFNCVPGYIIYNSDYTTFLYAVNNVSLLKILSTPGKDVTLFAPTNEQLEAYGIIHSKGSSGYVSIKKMGTDGIYRNMDSEDVNLLVQNHFAYGKYSDLSGDGYIRMASGNYIHYNNKVVYAGGNVVDGDQNNLVDEIENEKNGYFYSIDNVLKDAPTMAYALLNDPDYSKFTELLYKAELIDSVEDKYEDDVIYPRIKFIAEINKWTLLAPDNDAITEAEGLGIIPLGVDSITGSVDSLVNFIHYHFVRENVVFDDGNISGSMPSQHSIIVDDTQVYTELEFSNAPNNLSVTDKTGQTVNIDHADANTLVKYGVIHKVSHCLRFE